MYNNIIFYTLVYYIMHCICIILYCVCRLICIICSSTYLSALNNAGCTYGVVVSSCPIIVNAINLLCVAVAATQVLFLEAPCSQWHQVYDPLSKRTA